MREIFIRVTLSPENKVQLQLFKKDDKSYSHIYLNGVCYGLVTVERLSTKDRFSATTIKRAKAMGIKYKVDFIEFPL